MTAILSEENLTVCAHAGLPREDLAALFADFASELEAVQRAMRAYIGAEAPGSRCVTHIEARAIERRVSVLLVDAWWTTDTGADDLLEVGYEFCWHPIDARVEVEWFTAVGEHGPLVEGGRWTGHAINGLEAVASARTCVGRALAAFSPQGPLLAAAVVRLAQNTGVWVP